MKNKLQIFSLALFTLLGAQSFAQTSGNLTFSFTEVSKPASSTYGNTGKHVIAIWIENSSGTFIKSKIRYAGFGTADHLPTWATKSGGTAGNCMSSSCNVVSATTGATRSSFTSRTITWDGTDVSGTVVPDGTYKIAIQETWSHSGSGTAIRYFTFTKGPNADSQTPSNDANFSSISLNWTSTAGLTENSDNQALIIYPNPSADGIFTVDYKNANAIKVFNSEGLEVYSESLTEMNGSKTIDLSTLANGTYFVQVISDSTTSKYQVVIEK